MPNQISEAQQASWNKFAAGWKRWDGPTMEFLAAPGAAIVEYLRPSGNDTILDIASGTGEPGLTMAGKLSGGKVVLADLSENMLQVAKEKLAAANIKNVETRVADACELPFPDHSFDAVSCRMGFMFFPDVARAAKEMARVLKPGGRIAATVWGAPAKNYWVTCMVQNIGKYVEMPAPPPDAPGMFRCARPGLMAEAFTAAGLGEVAEREVPCGVNLGSAQGYWDMMTEVAAPFVAVLSKTDPTTVQKIKADVLAAMSERHPSGKIEGSATLVVGRRPR